MIKDTTIKSAVSALLTLKQNQEPEKSSIKRTLFSEEEIFLVFTLKVPTGKWSPKPRSIVLPHPLYKNASVCLIVKDPQAPWKEKIRDKEYPIEKVISLSKLKKNYAGFEEKRKLCQSYDLFLVDKRTHHRATLCFGSEFFSRKKHPISVTLSDPNKIMENLESIQKALTKTYFNPNNGVTTAIKFARTDFTEEQIQENLKVVVQVLKKHPGFDILRAVDIKTKSTMSLPLWRSPLSTLNSKITKKISTKIRAPPKTKLNTRSSTTTTTKTKAQRKATKTKDQGEEKGKGKGTKRKPEHKIANKSKKQRKE